MYAACVVNENYRHARKSLHMCNLHATNYCVLHASYLGMCKTHVCYTRKLHMCMLLQCHMCALFEYVQAIVFCMHANFMLLWCQCALLVDYACCDVILVSCVVIR